MTKISVIMPSYLGNFEGAAPDRKAKFVRAVRSFLKNTHPDKELVIISDGCRTTDSVCVSHFKKEMLSGVIRLVSLDKHEGFKGIVRQVGIEQAKGDIFCNLDSDDELMPHHLSNLAVVFDPATTDWVYFNVFRKLDELKNVDEHLIAAPNTDDLCTVNVAWKRGLDVTWNGCDGRQDNKAFNIQLIEKYPNNKKVYGCGYIIHHAVIAGATV